METKRRYNTPEMKVHHMSLTKFICGSNDGIRVKMYDESAIPGSDDGDGL